MPFAISPQDAARLETLSDPTLSPLQLAAWLAQPHIQQALEALEHLRALQRQRYHEQVAQEAIDTLRELSKTTDDPIERRRAATTILRALTRANHPDRLTRDHTQTRPRSASEGLPTPTPPRGGGQAHAQREPGGGASPASHSPLADSPPAASPPPPLLPSPQDSELRTQDSLPASPSGSSFILPPSSFPSSARPTRDHTQARPRSASEGLPTPTPPCGGGQAHAQREPGGGASPASNLPLADSPPAASPPPPLLPSPQDSGLRTQDSLPASHSVSPSLPLSVSAFPSSDRLTRDHTQTRPRSASEGLPTPTPPCGGGQAHAQREPGGGASPASNSPLADSPPAAAPPPPLLPSPQDSGLRTQDSPHASPSDSSFILPPSSFPSPARLTPDTLTAELTTRLRALNNPTPQSVRTTIWEGLDIKVWGDPKRSLDLSARIADGPLCDPALRDTTPTVEHIDTTDATATRRLRWPDTALVLHLVYDDGDNAKFFPRHWTLTDITTNHDPPNSS